MNQVIVFVLPLIFVRLWSQRTDTDIDFFKKKNIRAIEGRFVGISENLQTKRTHSKLISVTFFLLLNVAFLTIKKSL